MKFAYMSYESSKVENLDFPWGHISALREAAADFSVEIRLTCVNRFPQVLVWAMLSVGSSRSSKVENLDFLWVISCFLVFL